MERWSQNMQHLPVTGFGDCKKDLLSFHFSYLNEFFATLPLSAN